MTQPLLTHMHASPVSMANPAYHANYAPWLKRSIWWRDAKFALYLLFISTRFSLLCQRPLITGSLDVVLGSDFLRHTLMLPHVAPNPFSSSLDLSVRWQENIPPERSLSQLAHFAWSLWSLQHNFSLPLHCPSPTPGLLMWKTQMSPDHLPGRPSLKNKNYDSWLSPLCFC